MKRIKVLLILVLSITILPSISKAQINFGKIKDKAKEVSRELNSYSGSSSSNSESSGATYYVSASTGSNRNDGSKASPLKDLQKAVDIAEEGSIILVAEGNYQGKLDAGYIEIKKYISIVGGYSSDFLQRDPMKYLTMIQPGAATSGTGANKGLFDIDVNGNRNGLLLIDGIIFDKGEVNCYFIADPSKPKSGTPEGCITGRLDPPGFGSSGAPKMEGKVTVSNQLIKGDFEGQLIIRNCMFLNGSYFAIQMGNLGGHFDIYNNIFVNNRMSACEIRGKNRDVEASSLDFHHNTVLFTWRRDPMPSNKDMGYAFRFMTRINVNVYNNIFGCSDFAALDRTFIDSDKTKEVERKTSAYNNLFFANIEADLTLPSGGGKFMRVFAKSFEDVEEFIEYEGNREVSESEVKLLSKTINQHYLKGFFSMDGTSSTSYNPNSSENVFRSAMGMNTRGTSSYTVSMYSNRYPLEDALKLRGAVKGYGAGAIN